MMAARSVAGSTGWPQPLKRKAPADHWQDAPAAKANLVRCVRGSVHDVALDLRPRSAGHGRHVSVTLTAQAGNALFIPAGCAHGFLTLSYDAVVEYAMGVPYVPAMARGLRWNDRTFGVVWPDYLRDTD